MNKSELIRAIADKSDSTIVEVAKYFDAMLQIFEEAVASQDDIRITNYLVVSCKHVPKKNGRNPATGETIVIPAKNRVVIKAGKKLKEAANS